MVGWSVGRLVAQKKTTCKERRENFGLGAAVKS